MFEGFPFSATQIDDGMICVFGLVHTQANTKSTYNIIRERAKLFTKKLKRKRALKEPNPSA